MIYKITVPETNYQVEADNEDEAWERYECEDLIGEECVEKLITEDPNFYDKTDEEPGDIDSNVGFDPYMGCVTDDC